MTELQSSTSVSLQPFDPPGVEPVSAREIFIRLWTHRRLLISATLLAGLVAAAIVLVIPDQYTARGTILPEAQSNTPSAELSQLAASFGLGLGRAGNGLPELSPTMLTSDRILTPVIYQRLHTRSGDVKSLIQFMDLDKVDSVRAYERALRRFRDRALTAGARI